MSAESEAIPIVLALEKTLLDTAESYTGSYPLLYRRAAEMIAGPASVLVLPALYGFVRLDDALPPYEQRMDAPATSASSSCAQAAESASLRCAAWSSWTTAPTSTPCLPCSRTLFVPWADAAVSESRVPASPG